MSITRERRIKELFDRALEIPTGEREAFLETTGDLRGEVAALLLADAEAGDFLTRPASDQLRTVSLAPGDRVSRYTVVREIATGGSGAVYEAIQEEPRRRVALKVMRGIGAARREEAQILARLRHPGIAHVYEAGVHRGAPYVALEYIEGVRNLFDHARGLGRRERLDLMAQVCDAVHHAHQKGVIHRDLKPGNVLVDEAGRPKIIDFGIAREAGAEITRRDIVGTLPYMSPEQCEPGAPRVDVRSDVYSLGILLHEVLTGTLPVDVARCSFGDAVRRIREEAPAVDARLGGDVTAIVRKALAKDPEGRYASAAALAADIRRHLAHWPVEARPAGLLYQLRKFARRQRVAFLAVVAVVAVSVAAAVVNARLASERERQREAAEYQAYLASVAAASAALRSNDTAEARLRLESAPAAHRNWEWGHLRARLDMSAETIASPGAVFATGAVSPDGRLVAAASRAGEHRILVWDAATRKMVYRLPTEPVAPEALAFSRDGLWLIIGSTYGQIEIRDAASGALRRRFQGHEDRRNVTMLAFPPSGGFFASSSYDGTVKFWELESGRLLRTLKAHDRVFSVAFDPRGGRLATGGGEPEPTIRIWDLATGALLRTLEGHRSNVEDLAYSPDGARLASASMDTTVRLWDTDSGACLAVRQAHTAGVKSVAFGPDGRTFATSAWDRTVRLWSDDARELACFRGHAHSIYAVVYLDSRRIASFSLDGTWKLWDTEAAEAPSLLGHGPHPVRDLVFSEDGAFLASLDGNGGLRVWDAAARREVLHRELGEGTHALTAPNGERLLLCRSADLSSCVVLPAGDWSLPFGARLLATGRGRLYAADHGRVHVLDAATGRPQAEWRMPAPIRFLVVDPAGHWAAAATEEHVYVHDGGTLLEVASFSPGVHLRGLALSPDGRRLAYAPQTGRVRLLDWREGRLIAEVGGAGHGWRPLAFSPDGTRLATGEPDGTVRLWDPETGLPVLVLHAHPLLTSSVAWSADGRRLASAGGGWHPDGVTVRLWEAPVK